MPKKLEGCTLWIFLTPILPRNIKIIGKKIRKKSNNAKKLEGGAFSLARYCMLREKKGKTFLVVR